MDLLLPFAALLIFFILGIPIAFSLGTAGIIGIFLLTGDLKVLMSMVGLVTFDAVASYVLSAVPMFILMAFLTSSGGLATDMYRAAYNWTSNIRGGVAIGTVFACGIFGAMSGASLAAASVMSEIAVPNMRRLGYSEVLTGGVVSIGATLDILIPPSILFVIYGTMTNTSVGKLLLAGVIPGITLGIFLILCILFWVSIRPQDAPKAERVSWSERWRSSYRIWPCLLLIFIVMGLLYAGVATPTEVGGLGAFFAGLIGIILRRLTWAGALQAFKATVRISAMIFMILIGATVFGYFMTLSGIPQKVLDAVYAMNLNRWTVIVAICVSYFIFSMFMDELPLMLIYLQITFPLIVKLGFDPIWYGVVMAIMIMMGFVFPPVGLICFVVSSAGKIELAKVYKGSSILIIAIVMTLVLLMIFPGIALWLPSTMK
jgi:tripartite ATP-independent transporter DctM subunit